MIKGSRSARRCEFLTLTLLMIFGATSAFSWRNGLANQPPPPELRFGDDSKSRPKPISVPAFPGATGFGADTRGAYGAGVMPLVYHVTTLNDDGEGSLRYGLEDDRLRGTPRVIVFDTGGTIELSKQLKVRDDSFITIAGQTAPGDGINIRNAKLSIVSSHDIIIRGLRIRVGADKGVEPCTQRDAISIGSRRDGDLSDDPSHNIIVDHCSMSWTTDEIFSTWGAAHDITLQNSILSEPLQNVQCPDGSAIETHNYALLVGPCARRISLQRNFISGARSRAPLIGGGGQEVSACSMATEVEFINNVVYDSNWGAFKAERNRYAEGIAQPFDAAIIGNHYKDSGEEERSKYRFVAYAEQLDGGSRLYVHDNITNLRTQPSQDDWAVFVPEPGLATGIRAERSFVDKPVFPGRPIKYENWDIQEQLAKVGASAPERDADDARVIRHYFSGTGGYVSAPPMGYPDYARGTAQPDLDRDGIPDAWEQVNGLDPKNPSDAHLDANSDGYSNLEEYLNSRLD